MIVHFTANESMVVSIGNISIQACYCKGFTTNDHFPL